jgi:hypothetical protein
MTSIGVVRILDKLDDGDLVATDEVVTERTKDPSPWA